MSKAAEKIMEGLKEADAVAMGEPPTGTRLTIYLDHIDADDCEHLVWWLVFHTHGYDGGGSK